MSCEAHMVSPQLSVVFGSMLSHKLTIILALLLSFTLLTSSVNTVEVTYADQPMEMSATIGDMPNDHAQGDCCDSSQHEVQCSCYTCGITLSVGSTYHSPTLETVSSTSKLKPVKRIELFERPPKLISVVSV